MKQLRYSYDYDALALYVSLIPYHIDRQNTISKNIHYTYCYDPSIGIMINFDIDTENYITGIEIIGIGLLKNEEYIEFDENDESLTLFFSDMPAKHTVKNSNTDYEENYVNNYRWHKKYFFGKIEIGLSKLRDLVYIKYKKI